MISICSCSVGRGPRETSPGPSLPPGPAWPCGVRVSAITPRPGGLAAARRPGVRRRRHQLRQPYRARPANRADSRTDRRSCCWLCKEWVISPASPPQSIISCGKPQLVMISSTYAGPNWPWIAIATTQTSRPPCPAWTNASWPHTRHGPRHPGSARHRCATRLTALALAPSANNPFRLADDAVTLSADTLYYVPGTPASRRRLPWRERLASRFRGLTIEAVSHLRQVHPQTAVHIAKVTDYNADLADVLQRQYEAFREHVPLAGKRVVLKPNLVEYHRDKVINTHPHVVAAVIELCRREGRGGSDRRRGTGTLAQRGVSGQGQRPGRCADATTAFRSST